MAAAKAGDTVTLLVDISTAGTITINKNLTIDGNGKTLTYTGTDRAIDVPNTANGANVTIKNLTVNAEKANRGINYNTTGTLTVENVIVTPLFDDKIYNLLGVEVDENYKGIVIKNGQKYIQ